MIGASGPPRRPGRRHPTEQTKLASLSLLLVSAAMLLAGLMLPMMVPENAHWMTGPTLIQFGPQLLGEQNDGANVYFIIMASSTAAVGIALLLGAARLIHQWVAALLGGLAFLALLLSLFLTLVLLVGAAANDATAGVAAYSLPLGFLGTVLACFVPTLRDGWVRPPKTA